ncbi:phytoene desaturase family protein [Aeromicrobium chenweiae]|uniref:FAD-dependent oxidoreductase n=1 Tax=Aeromicrobium chenweiae TaxID=2079793 RepID=A0A2S0WK63_9ACTN|nr:NAD(P)/FAD-dependent oxidoreductase [Aeromicrobium chenweiae]AWB91630.1 FAD-dependent oxidoreductase [Aeromicrobium chenweiae]TGN32469.1 NAD(P)/FAD-dependent oxidoreductase [Aeromicrobium chenweiae]
MSAEHTSTDVVIVGGGHNALVASIYLARAGLDVTVLERLPHVGGAAVSARAFEGVDARLSRYSYLVSLMPQQLIDDLGLRLELRSRDTASYTPYAGGGLLVETDPGPATEESFRALTGSDEELTAWRRFYAEVATVAEALAPTLLAPLPHIGQIRDQVEMAIWTDLVDEPIGTAIERRFTHDLVRGVVGTDALIGTFASLHDSTLVQNRCFLYHLIGNGTGEWRVPVGGMGAVTGELERVAREAGVQIRTDAEVTSAEASDDGVSVHGEGFTVEAGWLLSGVAPYVLAGLLGEPLPAKPSGSQLKINLLLSRLPRLRSGIDPAVAFAGTFHLGESMSELETAHEQAASGTLPARAAGELYCHTLTDRSILGPELAGTEAQTLTYFGLHTPSEVLTDDAATEAAYTRVITALDEHLAEPIGPLIMGVELKTPAQIEVALGMPGGHIFHGDLQWPWLEEGEKAHHPGEKWGVATGHPRVLMCGSGARRGGAVSGIGGHNAAHAVLDYKLRQGSC